MGIHGIYKEIGPGERIALSKLAVQTYERKGRPLRLAIDISIWLFQIQSSKGGSNPALRTFYYRLLRLISLSIHPLFVFDGPNKPPFKRNKRTGPNVASIPEFLAKQLLKQFGLPFHIAPGEAEAECALLQKEGIVDAVLSEDVDTLMFGSGLTLRSWSAEPGTGTKVTTHVNLYDAEKTRNGPSKLDRPGMILVAMMSGGDYTPEGIPGIGPKTACEAARAGFGQDLYNISRRNKEGLRVWKERLQHELKTNESGFFRQKHAKQVIPEDFPREDILFYYTHPVISKKDQLEKLRQTLKWDQNIDVKALRTFCGEAFDWVCISGAKKFVRNLAPSLLVRDLRLRHERNGPGIDEEAQREAERRYILDIHAKRCHKSTDGTPELRVTFAPLTLIDIDLEAEDPDPEESEIQADSEDEETVPAVEADQEPLSPSKRRGPYLYDPAKHERIWLPDKFVRIGVPLFVQEWETKNGVKEAAKAAKQAKQTTNRVGKKTAAAASSSQKGALDRFTKLTKPVSRADPVKGDRPFSSTAPPRQAPLSEADPFISLTSEVMPEGAMQPLLETERAKPQVSGRRQTPAAFKLPPEFNSPSSPSSDNTSDGCARLSSKTTCITLLSSSPTAEDLTRDRTISSSNQSDAEAAACLRLPSSVSTRRRRSPLRRAKTLGDPSDALVDLQENHADYRCDNSRAIPSKNCDIIQTLDLLASPSPVRVRQTTLRFSKSPSRQQDDLPGSRSIVDRQWVTEDPPTPSRRAKRDSVPMQPLSGTPRNSRQRSITHWTSPTNCRNGDPLKLQTIFGQSRIVQTEEPRVSFQMPPPLLLSSPARSFAKEDKARTAKGAGTTDVKQKRNIRVRKSLDGAFALAETPPVRDKKRSRTLRVSQVEVLDLT